MADYQNANIKLVNQGLNIALPPDLIGGGKYTRLANVRTLQEGQMTTRFGLVKRSQRPAAVPSTSNVAFMAKFDDSRVLVVWDSGEVYIDEVPVSVYNYFTGVGWPRGSVVRENLVLLYPSNYSVEALRGTPAVKNISVVKFVSKISGDDWTYLATEVGMWKLDSDGWGYKWGIRPPVKLVENPVGSGLYDFQETRLNAPEIVTCPPDDEGDRACGLDNTQGIGTVPYVWVYTYYSSHLGAESNASGEMTSQVESFQSWASCPDPVPTTGPESECQKAVKLTGFEPPTDPQIDRYRIYRKGGGLPTYRLEDEIPIYQNNDPNLPTTFYISYKYDNQIAINQPLSEDNYVPFTTIVSPSGDPDPYGYKSEDPLLGDEISGPQALFETPMGKAWGPYQGAYIFATGDLERPGVVYWTYVGQPDGSSLFNELQVTSAAQPLIAGFIFGGNSYVWTKDELYALDYSGQSVPEFIPRQIPMGLGLSAPSAFAVGPNGVYFLSKDGVYVTDCTTFANSITKESLRPIFLGQEASDFKPVDWSRSDEFKMAVVAQELHFLYWDTEGDAQHLVYDIQQNRWQNFVPTQSRYVTALFGDINSPQYQIYMALSDGGIYVLSYGEAGDEIGYDQPSDVNVKFCTGAADAGEPLTEKEWGVLLVDCDMPAANNCVVNLYHNAEQEFGGSFPISTSGRQTVAINIGDIYSKNISVEFDWSGIGTIYQVVVQWRLDEEWTIHWFAPADALGIRGWKHVRDGYFALRSNSDVTLTVEIDGDSTFTYTIPSTGGELKSTHIWFNPVKGKMFQFSLDSAVPFRVYADDTFVNVKQWNTANTYTPFKIGGSGGYTL